MNYRVFKAGKSQILAYVVHYMDLMLWVVDALPRSDGGCSYAAMENGKLPLTRFSKIQESCLCLNVP
jgi:hypothetical protein